MQMPLLSSILSWFDSLCNSKQFFSHVGVEPVLGRGLSVLLMDTMQFL